MTIGQTRIISSQTTRISVEQNMDSAVKIIKRSNEGLNQVQCDRYEKSRSQNPREIAATIEGWISEFKQRKSSSISDARRAWRTLGEK
jgi:hypothetical protein